MAHDLLWDRRMLGAFLAAAILTEEEKLVLNDWVNGESIVYTSMMHPQNPMSVAKVNRLRSRIRQKYDRVQVYTAELPQRNTR
jgi:hypothetical protein